ncbi:MAG: hypothetical protein AAFY71_18580 [Bacteroidota bacterium]
MIIYGVNSRNLHHFNVAHTTCPVCQTKGAQQMNIMGKYFHVYGIPMFPVGRTGIAKCQNCGHEIQEKDFEEDLATTYEAVKKKPKRPWRHWGIIPAYFIISIAFNFFLGEKDYSTSINDQRQIFLNEAVEMMTADPQQNVDSLSFSLKNLFDVLANEEVNPEDFEYYSQQNTNKLLVLIRIPNMSQIDRDAWPQIIELVETFTQNRDSYLNKEQFIGVLGNNRLALTKSPEGIHYSSGYSDKLDKHLLPFYAPLKIPMETETEE